jgi:hypothetical protein
MHISAGELRGKRVFFNSGGVADANQSRAGKLGVIRVILSAIKRHKSAAPVAEEGFKALYNICENGSPVADYAKFQRY